MVKQRRWWVIGLAGVLACSEGTDPEPGPGPGPSARWQAFHIDDLKQQRAAQGVAFLQFLDEPSVQMGLYHLEAGVVDGQGPHGQDEVYYVVNGSAMIEVDGVDYAVAAGSSVFVRANASHRFHSITEELDVLVIFSKSAPNAADPAGLAFELDDVVASRNANQNVWNPFLQVATMSLGMYMLPQPVGGDATLTHTFDEINIVERGGSRFTMGEDTIDLTAGSIVYVEDGVGHRFHDLTDDIDIFIWWER